MNRDNGDFFKELRAEIEASKQTRSSYVRAKLIFLVGLFSAGTISITSTPTRPLLYLTTLVVLIFDLHIVGEDFGVKRAGAFLRENPYTPFEERRWEKTVSANRNPVGRLAGLLCSAFALLAAAVGLWEPYHETILYWLWLALNALLIIITWIWFSIITKKLDKLTAYLNSEFKEHKEVAQ